MKEDEKIRLLIVLEQIQRLKELYVWQENYQSYKKIYRELEDIIYPPCKEE